MTRASLTTLSESVSAFFESAVPDRLAQQNVLDQTTADVSPRLMEVIHHLEWLQPWFEPDEAAAKKLVRDSFKDRFPDLNEGALEALVQSAAIKRN